MWYDDYVGVIGSFCWYLYERIPGFEPTRNPHPSMVNAGPSAGKTFLDDWGGVINNGAVDKGNDALRWPDLYDIAKKAAATSRSRCPSARVPRTSRGTSTSTRLLLQECKGPHDGARAHLQ